MAYGLKIGNILQYTSIEIHRRTVMESLTPAEKALIKKGHARIVKLKITEVPIHKPNPRT